MRLWILLILLVPTVALAQFTRNFGVEVNAGDLVEGTAHVSPRQIQPHYLADFDSQVFRDLRQELRAQLAGRTLTELERIDAVALFVKTKFPRTNYDDPVYLANNYRYLQEGRPIPLSETINAKAGVCREHALLMHDLLRDQGIQSTIATVKVGPSTSGVAKTEDHSLLLVKDKKTGRRISVDPYFDEYHGQPYEDLVRGQVGSKGELIGRGRESSTRASVFPRVRGGPEKNVVIVGTRDYQLLIPRTELASDGTIKPESKFRYGLTAENEARMAKGLPPIAPRLGNSCRSSLLKALLRAAGGS